MIWFLYGYWGSQKHLRDYVLLVLAFVAGALLIDTYYIGNVSNKWGF